MESLAMSAMKLLVRHGTKAGYASGCKCDRCRKAQAENTAAIRMAQRKARIALEERLSQRLRFALYHGEEWLQPPRGLSPTVWSNEVQRTIARLERGNASVRRAAHG